MATMRVEAFSVSHAAVLDGTTGAETSTLYGCRNASIAADSSSYDNTGDDAILSTWYWLNNGTITVTGGYIAYDVLALLTNTTITSSGAAPNDYYNIDLWNESSVNASPRPILIRCPSRDENGVSRTLDFILYKVQFAPISFDGPQYKTGLTATYNGKALISSIDEKGATLTNGRAIGRIVSRPPIIS